MATPTLTIPVSVAPSSFQPGQQLHPHQGLLRPIRPVSEILSPHQPHHHHQNHPSISRSFQSTEAEAIDKWFEDLSQYEQTLEDMAKVSLDHVFKDELSTIESWFRVLSEAERTAALYSLLQHSSQVQIRFFITVLQQMARKDPVGALLSPTEAEKDPVQQQLHGAMAKAEKEASQRLLSVLPIQPPSTDRPVHRRLYDRHSVSMVESEGYSRLFQRDSSRNNNLDLLAVPISTSTSPSPNTNGTRIHGMDRSTDTVNHTLPTTASSGTSIFTDSITTRVHSLSNGPSSNRVSNPHLFGTRPKSVCEGEASSIFTTWNFASLGDQPVSGGNTSTSLLVATSTAASPGNIGDRTSLGRPKSVGSAEWMLHGSSQHAARSQTTKDPIEKSWTPLSMSPTLGGFHNGSNGSGHGLSGTTPAYSGPSLAVERPKSVTEADLAKLSISQWSLGNGSGLRTSTAEESQKSNRRRVLLRPSAIISNLPVTVLEGDEKLLSASANTSAINIVSSMFDQPTGTMPSLTATLAASVGRDPSSIYQYSSRPPSNPFTQQQAVLPSLSISDPPSALSVTHSVTHSQTYPLSAQKSQLSHTAFPFQPSQSKSRPVSRAQSPMNSPLPSPITAGFRSRPASRPTSPSMVAHNGFSVRNVWGSSSNGNLSSTSTMHHGSHFGYSQKRHLSPPGSHSLGSTLDDDSMSDTSDMSSLGMNGYGGRRGYHKEKKQEGVDFDLLQDTSAWLRSLRLHKYNGIFEGMHWREIVNLSDGDLINKGIAALGARRKMLKVFEQVRKEMLLRGMAI